MHWVFFLAVTFVLLFLLQVLIDGPFAPWGQIMSRMWFRYAPFFVVLLVLIPVAAFDSIRLSHRFAGPMVRIRGAMRRLAAGERVEPVHFRKGDFWMDLADDFNTVLTLVPDAESTESGPGESGSTEADQTEEVLAS